MRRYPKNTHSAIRGQSRIEDGSIVFQEKRADEIDIDYIRRMIYDAESIRREIRGNTEKSPFHRSYLERKAEKEAAYDSPSCYNSRLLDYPTGQHVTLYNKPVQTGLKNNKFSKSYRNENRTGDEERHCINVSLSKTKNTIYNIARSNVWDWFITLTLSPDSADRTSYDAVVKKLKSFLNNLQQRRCPGLKYLIVPELHADGASYHFHGLLAGCPELEFIPSGKHDAENNMVYNIPRWSYGFTTATPVIDTSRVSSYITKYITKQSDQYLKNKHRYYTNRSTLRSVPEKLIVSDGVEFIKAYADDIAYMKDVTVKPAFRKCTYLEMPY